MKILNGYCGIGGNRKLWGENHEITAVEIDPNIANTYKKLYPNDTVIIGDVHEYLLKHFYYFDFIWLSPPCPTHSKLRLALKNDIVYPDMSLYQEILLLKHWFKGKFVIENVTPYYDALIPANFKSDRHLFWSNFDILPFESLTDWRTGKVANEKELLEKKFGFDLSEFKGIDKRKVLRNCVVPELGLHIFKAAFPLPKPSKVQKIIHPSVSKPLLFDFA